MRLGNRGRSHAAGHARPEPERHAAVGNHGERGRTISRVEPWREIRRSMHEESRRCVGGLGAHRAGTSGTGTTRSRPGAWTLPLAPPQGRGSSPPPDGPGADRASAHSPSLASVSVHCAASRVRFARSAPALDPAHRTEVAGDRAGKLSPFPARASKSMDRAATTRTRA